MEKKNAASEINEMVELMQTLGERDALPSSKMEIVMNDISKEEYYTFDFGNPWYTGQFVSTIKNIAVKINNHNVDPEKVYFTLRGQRIQAETANTLFELWWGMGELAQLQIKKDSIDQYIQKTDNKLEITMDMRSAMSYGLPGNIIKYQFKTAMEVI